MNFGWGVVLDNYDGVVGQKAVGNREVILSDEILREREGGGRI